MKTHVTSLETSKRLKELGVPQKSEFHWVHADISNDNDFAKPELKWIILTAQEKNLYPKTTEKYSAFLCSELGELLPDNIKDYKARLRIDKNPNGRNTGWGVGYFEEGAGWHVWIHKHEDAEAEARGKLLIHLLENKLLILPSHPQ
jgi:hypothetical protein